MVSAINIIGNDNSLQDHWFKRLLALIIDNMIFWVIGMVLTIFIFQNWLNWTIPFAWTFFQPTLSGGLFFLYAFIMELSSGATLGKKVMGLRAISITGKLSAGQAAMRNVSKVHGGFLLIDWLVGFVSEGDPKQKWMDRVAGTTVVITSQVGEGDMHTYQAQQASYAPPPQESYKARHDYDYQYPPPPPPTSAPAQQQTQGQRPQEDNGQKCIACGGRMTMTGKGRMQCIRCGKIQ